MAETTGKLIDQLFKLRAKRRELDSQLKKTKEAFDSIELRLINKLDAEDTTLSRGKSASAGLSETEIPIIDNHDDFHNYIIQNNAVYLLQNRPSTAACSELVNSGEVIPGIRFITKRKISLRKL